MLLRVQEIGKDSLSLIMYFLNSAELIIEEKIDYNDLLNSIQDEAASLKKDVDLSASGNKSDESTNGTLGLLGFYVYQYFF